MEEEASEEMRESLEDMSYGEEVREMESLSLLDMDLLRRDFEIVDISSICEYTASALANCGGCRPQSHTFHRFEEPVNCFILA